MTRSIFLSLFLSLCIARAADIPGHQLSFVLNTGGQSQKVYAVIIPGKIRINQPDDKFALIYDGAERLYTGIEQRDAHYWQFRWHDVEAAIRESKRYEDRLHDLAIDGLASYDLERPYSDRSAPRAPVYIWRPGGKQKKIGSYNCDLWLGESDQGPQVEAWVVEQTLPNFYPALSRLKEINEPMALVAVHPLLPPIYFAIAESLQKAGVTPIELGWTKNTSPATITLKESLPATTRQSDWKIPEGYLKSELGALEGITLPAPRTKE